MNLVLYYGIYDTFIREYNIWIKLYAKKYNI